VGVLAALRFASEIAMLVALGFVGAWLGAAWESAALAVVLAVALPVAAATVWGGFVAPRASRGLPDPARLGVEVVLFGAAVAGLVWHGWWVYAVLLTVGYLASTSHGRAGG